MQAAPIRYLDDDLVALILSLTRCTASIGRAGSTCRRLRTLVTQAGTWRTLLRGEGTLWLEGAATVQHLCSPTSARARALAVNELAVLFDGSTEAEHALLVPLPGPDGALQPHSLQPLALREVWACAQADSGHVGLAMHRSDDSRRSVIAVAPMPTSHARSTKVRHDTLDPEGSMPVLARCSIQTRWSIHAICSMNTTTAHSCGCDDVERSPLCTRTGALRLYEGSQPALAARKRCTLCSGSR